MVGELKGWLIQTIKNIKFYWLEKLSGENGQGWGLPVLPVPKGVSFIQSGHVSKLIWLAHPTVFPTTLEDMKMIGGDLSCLSLPFLNQFTICSGKKGIICWTSSNSNPNDAYVTRWNSGNVTEVLLSWISGIHSHRRWSIVHEEYKIFFY